MRSLASLVLWSCTTSIHALAIRGGFPMRLGNSAGMSADAEEVTIYSLILRAQALRESLYGGKKNEVPSFIYDANQLRYPSTYNMAHDDGRRKTPTRRGYCNWLLPGAVMVGQYPGMTPEINGPSSNECRRHLELMANDAKVTLFCCLQSEIPPQDDDAAWPTPRIYLEPPSVRRQFPRPFVRYGPTAQSLLHSSSRQLLFLHNPIEDLNVPTNNESLLRLLARLLDHLQQTGDVKGNNEANNGNGVIYLHCWGGRGRAGLIGSCLASLFFPELSGDDILRWVQRGYDSREGSKCMPKGLRHSPQTHAQRLFVREFVNLVQEDYADMKRQAQTNQY